MPYPGSYNPIASRRTSRKRDLNGLMDAPWEILRKDSALIIRCWMPGVKREDIELTIRNHRLTLFALSSFPQNGDEVHASIRYQQEIHIPNDADTSWFAAEYHRGLLTIEFPLSDPTYATGECSVVVY